MRRIHMRDQAGTNKVEEIMHHFDRCSVEMWTGKFMAIGIILLLGAYWKF